MKKSLGVFVNALFLSALPGPAAAEGAYVRTYCSIWDAVAREHEDVVFRELGEARFRLSVLNFSDRTLTLPEALEVSDLELDLVPRGEARPAAPAPAAVPTSLRWRIAETGAKFAPGGEKAFNPNDPTVLEPGAGLGLELALGLPAGDALEAGDYRLRCRWRPEALRLEDGRPFAGRIDPGFSEFLLAGVETPADHLLYLRLKSMVLLDGGDLEEAKKVLAEGLALAPGDSGFYLDLGMADLRLGDYPAAVEAFEKGLKDLPANLYSRLLVQAYLGAGQVEAAEGLLRRVTGRTDVRTELAQLEAVLEKRQRAGP